MSIFIIQLNVFDSRIELFEKICHVGTFRKLKMHMHKKWNFYIFYRKYKLILLASTCSICRSPFVLGIRELAIAQLLTVVQKPVLYIIVIPYYTWCTEHSTENCNSVTTQNGAI